MINCSLCDKETKGVNTVNPYKENDVISVCEDCLEDVH